ncbi:TIGR03619 family F420-dependent LLM class oxidoreductase [Microlunatus parietis]|uniref:Putative F420-dependent oxidoreductase n=1 Tax=Microlunatus parietis TaxID=682979 RepID=A0A7Y9ID25_9ACTN|nr:TIGR03619 family F420-dependent LLM class oxidoreductase [Microlunatus parietis]NYE74361.1 putative F420-dependent oxidoreductase [Microlunatus parietis]
MHLEIVLPDESPDQTPDLLVDLARTADQAGFAGLYLPDHVLPPGEYGTASGFGGVYEALITLGHLAAVTRRIRLGTSVLVLPLRNPFVVAKQVATIDRLSGGRVVLGVGAGWSEQEYAAVGVPFGERGARLDEGIDLLRALWRGETTFTGQRFGFEYGVFEPKPGRAIPIMVGGLSRRAFRRVAERADEWQGLGHTPETFARDAELIKELTDQPLRLSTRIQWEQQSVAEIVETAHGFAEAGTDALAIWLGDQDQARARLDDLAGQPELRPFLTAD